MFKKQNFAVPDKQTSITEEQILHDVDAIRKLAQEENILKTDRVKREKWYKELLEFNNISNNLVGALDDGGDLRDQLQTLQKDLDKTSNKIKRQVDEMLDPK